MSPVLPDVLEQLLVGTGFIRDGQRSPGLLDKETVKDSITTDLRYRRLLEDEPGLDVGSTVDLVYECLNGAEDVPGTTCIYFKFLRGPLPGVMSELRRRVWNHGRSPTLWIVTPELVRIYDSFARPGDGDDDDRHILYELRHISDQLGKLAPFHKREFDSGAFWTSPYGARVKRSQRVDQAMLADLDQAEALLVGKTPSQMRPLSPVVAHALLGRSIFVSYLLDRHILDEGFFWQRYQCATFADLLQRVPATLSLFEWLGDTFNGDLFPLSTEERKTVEPEHLDLIRSFLRGDRLSGYPLTQGRLWPYRFDVIPVELISSIYEMFAYSQDARAAEARSVHYTRLPVVELLLSLAMRGVSHTARVLDPACGSGVFLVEAFRRLAWLRSRELHRHLRRDELHDLVRSQIFGMDIDAGAVQVAAFSLYLTLLELDPDPQPPAALRFPPLQREDVARGQDANLYVQDFCNTAHPFNQAEPFVSRGFDLIVGNPPWTGLKPQNAPRDPDDPRTGRQWSLEYCETNKIPDKNPDQAFMQRARDFARPETRIAFIIGSRLFAQQAAKGETRWLTQFLGKNTVEAVVNLSDLLRTDILFGGKSSTRLPASIMLFRASAPAESHELLYIAPMWYPAAKARGEIIVTSADIHTLAQAVLQESPFLWKSAFRGTPRDYRLLRKLGELPTLQQVIADFGLTKARGLTIGKGAKKRVPQFRDVPFLPSKVETPYQIDVTSLVPFGDREVAARSNTTVFQLPAVIFYRTLLEDRAHVAVVEPSGDRQQLVIDQMYNAVSLGQPFAWLGYRLNALLNSRMGLYLAFMFSASFGWNWATFEQTDYLHIRLPESIRDPEANAEWADVLSIEQRLRELVDANANALRDSQFKQMQADLDRAVYEVYGLSEQEIILTEDTIRYQIEPLRRRGDTGQGSVALTQAFAKPALNDLRVYATRVSTQLNGILRYGNLRLVPTVLTFKHSPLLRACRFTQRAWADDGAAKVVHLNDADELLQGMAQHLRVELADHLFAERDLRVYADSTFWIIKPAEKRLWSEAAALNDADAVLCEHMEAPLNG